MSDLLPTPLLHQMRNPMSTDDLLQILRERGLRLRLRPDGTPALVGRPACVTPALRDVLRVHRPALVERLRKEGGSWS